MAGELASIQELGKGTTRLVILGLLRRDEDYGYSILARLRRIGSPALPTTEGAVYPLLRRMESEGLLESAWRHVGDGIPARKYLRLTDAGRTAWAQLRDAWLAHHQALLPLLEAP